MKSLIFFVLLATFANIGYSQHYYNDIITTQQTNRQYNLLKAGHIQQVSAKSYEGNGEPSENFVLEQTIGSNGAAITTTAEYPSTGKSVSLSLYTNGKVAKTTDSTENIKSVTVYSYNGDNLVSIDTHTEDGFMNNASHEIHQWIYENNQPVKMLLIKNNADTTIIDFIKDEQGNIAEEHWKKKERTIEKYFYYYNEQKHLTDIVRYNIKAQRLLPDYLFEYDAAGTLTQLTQVPQGSADYLVWHYIYLANGLKQKELCYNKQKQLVGRIEYSYR